MKMKHKMITLAAVFLASVCSFGFGGRAEAAGGKILVAYFSYQGHTAGVAREIAEQTGGDLFEIKPVTPYPAYDECLDVAKAEKNNILESYDFSGKTVIPFATSGGSPLSDSLDSVRASAAGAAIGDGILANDAGDVAPWISGLGYAK